MISLAPSLSSAPPPEQMPVAIYYGYPSLVNGAKGDLEKAAQTFRTYGILVVGDGLEFSSHPDHGNLKRILHKLAGPRTFGYICIGSTQHLPLAEVRRRIQAWKQTGVQGVFLDEAGDDFGVSHERRETIIDIAHANGLTVMINAFQPRDVFIQGTHLRKGDFLLLESFVVRNGKLDDSELMNSRIQEAQRCRHRYKVGLAGITTTSGSYSADLFHEACKAADKASLDGIGWGEPGYSSSSNRLSEVVHCIETSSRATEEGTLSHEEVDLAFGVTP